MQPLLFVVISGGDLTGGGSRIALHDVDELTLGRGPSRALVATGPRTRALRLNDGRMSTTHARVVRAEERFVVEDLASTNGTVVNGEGTTRARLDDGDVIEIGQTVLVYREIIDEGRAGDLDAADLLHARPGFATLDPVLARRFARLERVASSTLSVLLIGETGTGKEVLARGIHAASQRPGAFVAVNCGAIPSALVESHLFGHTKGAFSGAVRDEVGHVRAASSGTLLLDEIGDLPKAAQAALLRVLQEGEVVPVGSAQPIKVDVRVLGATHKPLDQLVASGEFRQDLYARLAGYVFPLPPLRERTLDLGLFVASMIASGKIERAPEVRLHREVTRAMLRYSFPMNVRELEQCVRASAVLADDGLITLADIPAAIAEALDAPQDDEPEVDTRDEELRRELLARLTEASGNVTEVARLMGKARQQIQRWLRRFAIDAEAYKKPR